MIAGEICENRHGERAAPQTVHGQRMGTRFKHRVRAAGANDFSEVSLQIQRFGRGVRRRTNFSAQPVAYGAKQPGLAARRAQDRIHKIRNGGFAVRPSDADKLQNFRGTAIEIRSGNRQGLSRVSHLNPRKLRGKRSGIRQLAHHGNRAAGQGVGHKFIAVGFFSADGNEQRAGFHGAAVIGNGRDLQVAVCGCRARSTPRRSLARRTAARAVPADVICASLSTWSATLTAFVLTSLFRGLTRSSRMRPGRTAR